MADLSRRQTRGHSLLYAGCWNLKTTIALIAVHPMRLAALHILWDNAQDWLGAANGRNPFYRGPIALAYARKAAQDCFDKYFAAIDALVVTDNPSEKKEPA